MGFHTLDNKSIIYIPFEDIKQSLYPVLKYEACLKLLCVKGYKSFSIFST